MTAPMTVEEFDKLVARSFELKRELTALEEAKKPLNEELYKADQRILEQLQALGVNSFRSSSGLISKTNKYSVTTPKTREDKEAFFAWLRSKGEDVYWQHVGINSLTLQSIYKQEFEAAKEAGDLGFEIPGVGSPVLMESLSRRAK